MTGCDEIRVVGFDGESQACHGSVRRAAAAPPECTVCKTSILRGGQAGGQPMAARWPAKQRPAKWPAKGLQSGLWRPWPPKTQKKNHEF